MRPQTSNGKSYIPNATACSLLGFLYDTPLSGWDLYARATLLIGEFWSMTRSQVYRELITLAEQGLIEPQSPGKRERRPYAITTAGRRVFLDWLHEEPDSEMIRFPLLIKLTFGQHLQPGRAKAFLQTQQRRHEEQLRLYQHHRAGIVKKGKAGQYLLATIDFGIAYEEAFLKWLRDLPASIIKPS